MTINNNNYSHIFKRQYKTFFVEKHGIVVKTLSTSVLKHPDATVMSFLYLQIEILMKRKYGE
jgi:hypothetical protein